MNNEEPGILKREKSKVEKFIDSNKTFEKNSEIEKANSNNTLNNNIINDFIKAEAVQILSDRPEKKIEPAEEMIIDKKHIRNVGSSLETDVKTTDGKIADLVSGEETIEDVDNQADNPKSSIDQCSSNPCMESNNGVQEGTLEIVANSKQDENEKGIIKPEEVTSPISPIKLEKSLSQGTSEGIVAEIEMPLEEMKPKNDNCDDESNQIPVTEHISHQETQEDSNGAQKPTESENKLSSDVPKELMEEIEKPLEEERPQDDKTIVESDKEAVSELITEQEELLDAPQKPIVEVAQQDDDSISKTEPEGSVISRTTSNRNLSSEDLEESLKRQPHIDEVEQQNDETLVQPTQDLILHSKMQIDKLDDIKELSKTDLKQHSDADVTPVDIEKSEEGLQQLQLEDKSIEEDSKLNNTEENGKGSNAGKFSKTKQLFDPTFVFFFFLILKM